MAPAPPRQRVYDHRLRQLVWETGDTHLFPELNIPRSTLAGWLRDPPPDVITAGVLETNDLALALRMKKLERHCGVLMALVRLLFTLVRVRSVGLDGPRLLQLPDGAAMGSHGLCPAGYRLSQKRTPLGHHTQGSSSFSSSVPRMATGIPWVWTR